MDRDKKRIVVNNKVYNENKTEFDIIERSHFVIIYSSDLIPIDKIYILESHNEFEKLFIKTMKPIKI